MWPHSHAIYLFRAARAIRTIPTYFTTYSGRQSHPIQPIRIHAYLHAYLRCLQRVQQESIQSKLLVETAQLSQCSLPTIGSAGGHPFHYSVGITAYLQCLRSPTFRSHGGKLHPSRTERPMGTATPHDSHAEWLFLMILLGLTHKNPQKKEAISCDKYQDKMTAPDRARDPQIFG